MNRRGFLAALAVAPVMPLVAKAEGAPVAGAVHGREFVASARGAHWAKNLSAINANLGVIVPSNQGKLPDGAVAGEVIDAERLLISFSDQPCSSIEMYDGHAALTFDRDCSTKEELLAATGNPGHYVTCCAEGMARPFGTFNGRPAYRWGAIVG